MPNQVATDHERAETYPARQDAAHRGQVDLGFDFYMVDPRDVATLQARGESVAAPWHIENVEDVQLFLANASPWVPWLASACAYTDEASKLKVGNACNR